MSTPFGSPKKEQTSTYFVQDRQSEPELQRLMIQDQMLTKAMGGVLPEQDKPASLRRVLDIGCGTGAWVIDAAQTYPQMSLMGIDISQRMINYARQRALELQIADRVEFHVMDALLLLEFPNDYFDLVNLRLGVSYLRTWDWPKVLSEMRRVTHPGGIIRVTDQEILQQGMGPAGERFCQICLSTFFRAGNLFEEKSDGLTAHLARLLKQNGCKKVKEQRHALEFQNGTEQGNLYHEDGVRISQTLRPFFQKWGCLPDDYDELCAQMLVEGQQPDFHSIWNYLTAWGVKS